MLTWIATNIDNIARNGPVVASFPAAQTQQLMLVTDQAKLIHLPLETLRVIGRGSAGVRLFNVSNGEHVVSAVRLDEEAEEEVAEVLADETVTDTPPAPDEPEAPESED